MIPNTTIRLELNTPTGRWSYRLLALVSATADGHDVAITEVTEASWRSPKEVVRFVSVAEFMTIAAAAGLSRGDVLAKVVAKFVANTTKRPARKVA